MAMLKGVVLKDVDRSIITDESLTEYNNFTYKPPKKSKSSSEKENDKGKYKIIYNKEKKAAYDKKVAFTEDKDKENNLKSEDKKTK